MSGHLRGHDIFERGMPLRIFSDIYITRVMYVKCKIKSIKLGKVSGGQLDQSPVTICTARVTNVFT